MREFESFIIVVGVVLVFGPILPAFSGAGECRTRTLECYNCDSRIDPYCERVDRTNLSAIPDIRSCQGCCVKFFHDIPGQKPYVQRTCTEHIIINYFMVDHVCMSEGKGHGKMCFCEDTLCNVVPPTNPPTMSLLVLLSLGTAFS